MSNGGIGAVARGALALAAVLLGGCGVDRDYEAAVRTNTIVAFDDYLRLHPDGAHAADARMHLATLVEEREWQRALSRASVDSYQQYLRGYPSGIHSKEAQAAIADLNAAAMPSTEAAPGAAPPAPSGGRTPRTTKGAIARPAAAPSVPPVPTAVVAGSAGIRLQLGAFGSEAAARSAWSGISARHPELATHALVLVPATLAGGRRVERLQLAGFDRDSAAAACAALANSHDACLVVPATGTASQ